MNIPPSVNVNRGKGLHKRPHHPLCIIKEKIYQYFGPQYQSFDDLNPEVSVRANFDDLLIPADHPCRKTTDTYYIDSSTVLRTQTSAHQTELMRKGYEKFLVSGDVFRKDEVDRTHYPVFHQMEGVCIGETVEDLHRTMKGLMSHLFPNCECRINDDYFPFTDPSFEIEVYYGDQWLEVAGCGMIQPKILESVGWEGKGGWAFGLGLERLAMILFNIPDIRLFWSDDPKFTSQFRDAVITRFTPFSVLNSLQKDISFFIPDTDEKDQWEHINDFYEICRSVSASNLEQIECFDKFYHPKKKMMSHAYRLTYSAPDTLSDPGTFSKRINTVHARVAQEVGQKLNVIIR